MVYLFGINSISQIVGEELAENGVNYVRIVDRDYYKSTNPGLNEKFLFNIDCSIKPYKLYQNHIYT